MKSFKDEIHQLQVSDQQKDERIHKQDERIQQLQLANRLREETIGMGFFSTYSY